MTENTQNPTETALKALTEAMLAALADTQADPAATMENQAKALDLVFRHNICKAGGQIYNREEYYRIALRAQSQYRYTLKALRDHNNPPARKSLPPLQT